MEHLKAMWGHATDGMTRTVDRHISSLQENLEANPECTEMILTATTTLFAALNTANGEVYHLCQQRHRHQEWLKFLRMIDQTVPADKQIHVICDNYGTHKHQRVQRWLERHQRFHVHFTPTSASWLNMIERFFGDLTENRIRRGVFQDLEQLIMAIGHYIDRHNESPKPFIWTAKASDILEKVTRARAALNK
jgi:transposase